MSTSCYYQGYLLRVLGSQQQLLIGQGTQEMSNSLLASASRMLWRTIQSYGVEADRVFQDAGILPRMMEDPQGRFPVELARKAWTLAAETIADPCFGINTGRFWFPTDLHALGIAFLSSTSLYTGLHRIARYNAIVDEVINFTIKETPSHLIMSYDNDREELPDIPALEVARWSIIVAMCRTASGAQLSAGRFAPERVELVQKEVTCCEAYQHYFGCDIAFDMPKSQAYFDIKKINTPLPAPHSDIAKLHDSLIGDYLNRLHQEHALSHQIAHLIRDILPSGNISDQVVADAVFMSPRTLQRKLASEGSSFNKILQDVRLAMANEYLRDDNLSLIEVSYLLGFSTQSSFTRAYKRWTGKPPSAERLDP